MRLFDKLTSKGAGNLNDASTIEEGAGSITEVEEVEVTLRLSVNGAISLASHASHAHAEVSPSQLMMSIWSFKIVFEPVCEDWRCFKSTHR